MWVKFHFANTFVQKLTYLRMLFILQPACAVDNEGQLKNKEHVEKSQFAEAHTRKVQLGSNDCAG